VGRDGATSRFLKYDLMQLVYSWARLARSLVISGGCTQFSVDNEGNLYTGEVFMAAHRSSAEEGADSAKLIGQPFVPS